MKSDISRPDPYVLTVAADLRQLISDGWVGEEVHLDGRCLGDCRRQFHEERTPKSYHGQLGLEVPA